MGEYRFWLSAIPKNHQRVGKKMGRQKNGAAKKWSVIPWFSFFAQPFFCPLDFNQQNVESSFYSLHAIYLWITAAEWLLGLLLPWILLRKQRLD